MIRLGKRGYRCIMLNLTRTADYLASCLEHLGFIIMSKKSGQGLPLVAFRLDPEKKHVYDEFAVAHSLRERGWVVPAYTMAPHSEGLKLMRVVVREDFSRSRCDSLVADFKIAVDGLNKLDAKKVEELQEYDASRPPWLCVHDVKRADDHLGVLRRPPFRNGNQAPRVIPSIRMNSTRCKAKPERYEVTLGFVLRSF